MMSVMNEYVQRRISQPEGGVEEALASYFGAHPRDAWYLAMEDGTAPEDNDCLNDWLNYLHEEDILHLLELGMISEADDFYYDVWYDFRDDGGMYIIWDEDKPEWAANWAVSHAEKFLSGEFDDCDMPDDLRDILSLYRPGGMERAYKYATYTQQAMDALRSKNARKKRGMFR